MLATWYELLLFFQPEAATGGGGGGSAPAEGGAPPPAGCEGALQSYGLIIVMIAVFYFLLIRPQQRQAKQREAMLKALEKGQTVRTSGGIRGEITALDANEATVLIAPKVKIQVARANILGVVKPDGSLDEGDAKKNDKSKSDEDKPKSEGPKAKAGQG